MVEGMMADLFVVNGKPPEALMKTMMKHVKKDWPAYHSQRRLVGGTFTMSTVNVDQKLGLDKFHVDEESAHIVLKDNVLCGKPF